MEKKAIWCGDDRKRYALDELGFLLELSNRPRNWRRLELRAHPACIDGTPDARLHGAVGGGATQVTALGVGKIVEVAPNGRGRVEILEGEAQRDALNKLGYPDLA